MTVQNLSMDNSSHSNDQVDTSLMPMAIPPTTGNRNYEQLNTKDVNTCKGHNNEQMHNFKAH